MDYANSGPIESCDVSGVRVVAPNAGIALILGYPFECDVHHVPNGTNGIRTRGCRARGCPHCAAGVPLSWLAYFPSWAIAIKRAAARECTNERVVLVIGSDAYRVLRENADGNWRGLRVRFSRERPKPSARLRVECLGRDPDEDLPTGFAAQPVVMHCWGDSAAARAGEKGPSVITFSPPAEDAPAPEEKEAMRKRQRVQLPGHELRGRFLRLPPSERLPWEQIARKALPAAYLPELTDFAARAWAHEVGQATA